MSDIVETIQAEQDRIIRADHRGVLVVQGGPGTGKTAVALHRAAYLLYTHRERLARSGRADRRPEPDVPALHRRRAALPRRDRRACWPTSATCAPGVARTRRRAAGGRRGEGPRWRWPTCSPPPSRDRQAVPDAAGGARRSTGRRCGSTATDAARPAPAARRARRLHNEARPAVRPRASSTALAQQVRRPARRRRAGRRRPARRRRPRRRSAASSPPSPSVQAPIDRLWPRLTPRAAAARPVRRRRPARRGAPGWSDADRDLLLRDRVGPVDPGRRTAAGRGRRAARRRRLGRAGRGPSPSGSAGDGDAQGAWTCCTARARSTSRTRPRPRSSPRTTCSTPRRWPSARRYATPGRTAERAAADRTWTFGHVIVDEAQELSPMAWRLLMRRCPTRSMTLVGDVAQTGDAGRRDSWAQVLTPYVGDRWRLAELTVNYRTPAEIMAVAAEVLAAIGVDRLEPPQSVRSTGVRPVGARGDRRRPRRRRRARSPPSSTRRTGTLAVARAAEPARRPSSARRLPGRRGRRQPDLRGRSSC